MLVANFPKDTEATKDQVVVFVQDQAELTPGVTVRNQDDTVSLVRVLSGETFQFNGIKWIRGFRMTSEDIAKRIMNEETQSPNFPSVEPTEGKLKMFPHGLQHE